MSRDKIKIGTLDSGGIEFPDLMVIEDVYLLSDIVIEQIRKDIEDYVFLKPIEVCCDAIGKKELYWLVIPPKIDCLDLDKSDIVYNWNFDWGIIPILHCNKTVIDESLTGRYKMFKVSGVDDHNIYLKEELAQKIQSVNPDGIKLILSEEE
jgi:hypothetical protein